MYSRLFFCVILLFSVVNLASAQNNTKCGTNTKYLNPATLRLLQTPPNECNYIEKARKTFQITAHVSRDSLQPPLTSLAQINIAIADLNAAFEPCHMSFEICEVNYLQDFHFYDWSQEDDEAYAVNYHYVPNTINMYFSSTVETIAEGVVGGYAYLPDGPEMIVIGVEDDGTVPPGTVIHEMGHFFGLLHTFEIDFGVEDINQGNCSTSGDFICDTEADPGGDLDDECVYISPLSDGTDFYTPPTDNWMSYYGECRCRFTIQQLNRMVEFYLSSNRYNLW